MDSYTNPHDDRKLIAAIAGVIVVGAVAIALIAGLPDSGSDPVERPVAVDAAAEPFALPAVSPPDRAGALIELATLEASPETTTPTVEVEPSIPEISFTPQPGENLVAEGLSAFRAREFERGAIYFAAQAEARADDAWARYMNGLCLWKAGLLDEAAAAMRESTEVDPGSAKGWINLCRIENDRIEYSAAVEAARKALEVDPESAEAMFVLARSLYNLSRTAEAEEQLEASIERDPGNAYALNLLGLMRIERNDGPAAVEALELAAGLAPDVGFVQNNFGMALELAGRPDEAAVAYAAAVTAEPGHGKAAANLARLGGAPEADPQSAESSTDDAEVAQDQLSDKVASVQSEGE